MVNGERRYFSGIGNVLEPTNLIMANLCELSLMVCFRQMSMWGMASKRKMLAGKTEKKTSSKNSVKSNDRHLGFTLTTKVLSLFKQNATGDSDILKSPED